MSVTITFGALAEPLYKQIGWTRRRCKYIQDCADSIVTLAVGQIITEGEADKARRRLLNRIAWMSRNPHR